MSIIFKKEENKPEYPFIYIDSINTSSYMKEMISYTLKHIREVSGADYFDSITDLKPSDHMAKNEQQIYKSKKDGFWIVTDELYDTLTLYKRETSTGTLWNSVYVSKIYSMRIVKCPKIVPKVFEKVDKHQSFIAELRTQVEKIKNIN
jgi:hypothetical protein